MLSACNVQYITIDHFRPSAINVDITRGTALVQVLSDHTMHIQAALQSRLNDLPVQVSLINFVEADFNAMSHPMQELMKTISIYAHSFTRHMLADVISRHIKADIGGLVSSCPACARVQLRTRGGHWFLPWSCSDYPRMPSNEGRPLGIYMFNTCIRMAVLVCH